MFRRLFSTSFPTVFAGTSSRFLTGFATEYEFDTPESSEATTTSLTESSATVEFKRYCTAHNCPEEKGVPLDSFAAWLESNGYGTGGEKMIRALGCFRFQSMRAYLPSVHHDPIARYQPAMARLAAELPRGGATQAEVREMLNTLAPGFLPSVRGLMTFNEAMGMYPDLFYIGSKVNQWSLKPRPSIAPPALSEPSVHNPSQVEFEVMMREALFRHRKSKTLQQSHWVDVENLICSMRDKLEQENRNEVDAWGTEHWVSRMMQLRTLEHRGKMLVRPRWKPRGIHLFVDGDNIGGEEVANKLIDDLKADLSDCTLFVARKAWHAPITKNDVVIPKNIPTYMVIERAAEKLKARYPLVLRDVIVICSDQSLPKYKTHFTEAVPFPDAEVFIVSPRQQIMVSSWRWPERD